MNNRLMVYVRVKPLSEDSESRSMTDVVDDKTLIFDPIDPEADEGDTYFYHGRPYKDIGKRKKKNTPYIFDGVFDDRSTNRHIFETVTRPMVDATIDGYNCSVFAYGATGSGKTFTMLGKPHEKGVIYYTAKDLFEKLSVINDKDPLQPPQLKICYFEIYNEKIRDLLVFEPNFIRCGNKRLRTTPERCRARATIRDGCNLPVCESSGTEKSLVIPDLTYHSPENAEQLIELLEAGNEKRSQQSTHANADSSRSHAIFQIMLTRRTRRLNNNQPGSEYELQNSKMSLIDLAGSERASVAYRHGCDRGKSLQREGTNINKSLLALGNCINALASKSTHIPYRNSKLTRLLRDSLGGRCRTAMIATISQQHKHYEDTQNTLLYASRAKCIKLDATRNFTNVAYQPRNYSIVIENQNKRITLLESENEQLKSHLIEMRRENDRLRAQPRLTFTDRNPNATFITAEKPQPRDNRNQPESFLVQSEHISELKELYKERSKIRFDILKCESESQTNKLLLTFKQLDEARQQKITRNFKSTSGNSTFLKDSELTGTLLINHNNNNNDGDSQAIRSKLRYYDQKLAALNAKAETYKGLIEEVLQKMSEEFVDKRYGSFEEFLVIRTNYVKKKERKQQLEERQLSMQHAYDLAQEGFKRLSSTEDLLNEAASVVKYAHTVYTGRGDDGPTVSRLGNLLNKLGKKSVIWKDDKYEMENNKDNQPLSQLASVHENFSLSITTPSRNNNTLQSRRLSKNLVKLSNYTPEQSNLTFDASS